MLRLKVAGMSCAHCVAAVTRAVQAVPLANSVAVDLDRGEVTIGGSPDEQAVREAISAEGYKVQAAG